MILKTNHYNFWIKRHKHNKTFITYDVGNPHCKPMPCVRLSLDKYDHQWHLIIQDIMYYSTCAKEGLIKGDGTVEMVKGALVYLVTKYNVASVSLSDKSFVPNPDNPVIISERRLLAGKPSWYEEYLGAVPYSVKTQHIIEKYATQRKRKLNTDICNELQISHTYAGKSVKTFIKTMYKSVNNNQLKILRAYLHIESLVGSSWMIPISLVRAYNVHASIHKGDIQFGGNSKYIQYDQGIGFYGVL